jgi:hypothetical protein
MLWRVTSAVRLRARAVLRRFTYQRARRVAELRLPHPAGQVSSYPGLLCLGRVAPRCPTEVSSASPGRGTSGSAFTPAPALYRPSQASAYRGELCRKAHFARGAPQLFEGFGAILDARPSCPKRRSARTAPSGWSVIVYYQHVQVRSSAGRGCGSEPYLWGCSSKGNSNQKVLPAPARSAPRSRRPSARPAAY